MKTKLNSQICTTREQSERLLALGLRKETADMALVENWDWNVEDGKFFTGEYFERPIDYVEGMRDKWIPAWSLHRIMSMLPRCVENGYHLVMSYDHIAYRTTYDDVTTWWRGGGNLYDMIVETIKWLIKEGYFNKEYLVDLMGTDAHQDMVDSFRYALEALKKED